MSQLYFLTENIRSKKRRKRVEATTTTYNSTELVYIIIRYSGSSSFIIILFYHLASLDLGAWSPQQPVIRIELLLPQHIVHFMG